MDQRLEASPRNSSNIGKQIVYFRSVAYEYRLMQINNISTVNFLITFRPKPRAIARICWSKNRSGKMAVFTQSQRRTSMEKIQPTSRLSWSIDQDRLKVPYNTLAPRRSPCPYPGTNLWMMVDPTSPTTSLRYRSMEPITGVKHQDTAREQATPPKVLPRARNTCSECELKICTVCLNHWKANQSSPRVHTIHQMHLVNPKSLDTRPTAVVFCGIHRSILVANLLPVRRHSFLFFYITIYNITKESDQNRGLFHLLNIITSILFWIFSTVLHLGALSCFQNHVLVLHDKFHLLLFVIF